MPAENGWHGLCERPPQPSCHGPVTVRAVPSQAFRKSVAGGGALGGVAQPGAMSVVVPNAGRRHRPQPSRNGVAPARAGQRVARPVGRRAPVARQGAGACCLLALPALLLPVIVTEYFENCRHSLAVNSEDGIPEWFSMNYRPNGHVPVLILGLGNRGAGKSFSRGFGCPAAAAAGWLFIPRHG